MAYLPDLTPAEQAAFAQKYDLHGPLRRLESNGIVNRVYQASLHGQKVVLRAPMPGDEEDTLTESVAAPAAFQAGVNTPELLIFDHDRDVLNAPVTVYAWVPGQNLNSLNWAQDDPQLHQIYRMVGRELAQLHATVQEVPDPHGYLENIEPCRLIEPPNRLTCQARLATAEAAWAHHTTQCLLTDAPPPAPAFLHNDLHAGNLMVRFDGEITALIDWGDAGWHDPALDLRYLGPLAVPHVLRGYEEAAPGQLGDGATLRLLAYLLDEAARGLLQTPEPGDTDENWFVRPGTPLMQLLRIVPLFPEWQEYLSAGAI